MLRIVSLLFALSCAFPALCADLTQWNNLQSLHKGDRIGLVQSDRTKIEGVFESFTDTGITLTSDQQTTVPKDKVIRAYRRHRLNRKARLLIGGAAGVALGAILTGTVGRYLDNEGHGTSAGAFIGGGAAVGIGLGALAGGGDQMIYQRSLTP